jgi:hypothetical protein
MDYIALVDKTFKYAGLSTDASTLSVCLLWVFLRGHNRH